MNQRKRPAPRQGNRPSSDTTNAAKSTAELHDERHLVGDASIWEALFDGKFRLAVQCDTCGRWLTSGASRRAHRGPVCRARGKAVTQ